LLLISAVSRSACPGRVLSAGVPACFLLRLCFAGSGPAGLLFHLMLYSLAAVLRMLRLCRRGSLLPAVRTAVLWFCLWGSLPGFVQSCLIPVFLLCLVVLICLPGFQGPLRWIAAG